MATTNPLIKDVKDIIACQRFLETNGTESNGVWSWYDFIDSDNVDSPTAGQPTQKDDKILVAQTSGYNAYYRDMMSITSHVNRAYSRHWGYDFVTFEGILLGCLGSHSSFNKIGIIQEAIERQYDALLLLDADAMVVDLDMSIRSVLPIAGTDTLLSGHGKQKCDNDPKCVRTINNGVMALNLRHPKMQLLLSRWHELSMEKLVKIAAGKTTDMVASDQQWLREAYRTLFTVTEQMAYLNYTDGAFKYREGTFIKHFIRTEAEKSNTTYFVESDKRMDGIRSSVAETRQRFDSYF